MTLAQCPTCGILRRWSMEQWIAHRLANFATHLRKIR